MLGLQGDTSALGNWDVHRGVRLSISEDSHGISEQSKTRANVRLCSAIVRLPGVLMFVYVFVFKRLRLCVLPGVRVCVLAHHRMCGRTCVAEMEREVQVLRERVLLLPPPLPPLCVFCECVRERVCVPFLIH